MTDTSKRNLLLILGSILILMAILAASLPQLEFKPGMPLPRLEEGEVVVPVIESEPLAALSLNQFMSMLLGLLLTISLLYMVVKVLRGTSWKEVFSILRIMLVIFLGLFFILVILLMMPRESGTQEMEMVLPTPKPIVTAPLGPVPPLLLWIVGLGLLFLGILIAVLIIRSSSKTPSTIDLLGFEAEKAWQDLRLGQNLKDVIIKCYWQMSLVLEKEQGVERKDFMTTGEFEQYLRSVGVPQDPIHRLTRLFETARYGRWQPNTTDEQDAIHSLEAILTYCQSVKKDRRDQ